MPNIYAEQHEWHKLLFSWTTHSMFRYYASFWYFGESCLPENFTHVLQIKQHKRNLILLSYDKTSDIWRQLLLFCIYSFLMKTPPLLQLFLTQCCFKTSRFPCWPSLNIQFFVPSNQNWMKYWMRFNSYRIEQNYHLIFKIFTLSLQYSTLINVIYS